MQTNKSTKAYVPHTKKKTTIPKPKQSNAVKSIGLQISQK